MPAALERKLKREAAKDPSIKDKDAYVYGTLRKTGWKPSREKKKTKKMSDPTGVISAEDKLKSLEHRFQYDPDNERTKAGFSPASAAGGLVAGAGIGYGGLKAHQAIAGTGGYGANLDALKNAFKATTKTPALAEGAQWASPGSKLGALAGKAGLKVGDIAESALSRLSKFFMEDPTRPIAFQYDPNPKRATSMSPTGVNPSSGAKAVAGASGGLSNVQRSLANAPKGPGVSGAVSTFGKTATGMEKLKKFFNPATAAKLAIYESREKPQIFESAEETLQFQGPVVEATEAAQKGIGPATKKLLGKIGAWTGGTVGTYGMVFPDRDDKTFSFDEHILEPWQGVMSKSKIVQEEFPAGLSPAMALRFPLPKIMRFLKARRPQLLQEQFPGFSSRMEKLIKLNSKLDELQFYVDVDYENSADRHKTVKQGAGIAIAGGAVGTGYLGHRAIMKHYGRVPTLAAGPSPAPGFQNTMRWGKNVQSGAHGRVNIGARGAYKAALSDVQERAANRLRRATRVGKFTYGRLAEGGGLGTKAVAAAKGVYSGLRHLNAQLDDVIEFGIKKN